MPVSAQRGVASIEVGGVVLRALRESDRPVTLAVLSSLTGLTPSRLHHYLVSLARIGLVQRDAGSGTIALGSFAMELGLVAADKLELQHASAVWLRRLSGATGESSFFAVGSPQGALIVRWEQGLRPLTVHARLGTVMPILTTATGLVWLAYDFERCRDALEAELRRLDPTLRRSARERRLAEAKTVKRIGMATASGSFIGNVKAFACPIVSKRSGFHGVMTVLGLGGFFDDAPEGTTAAELRSCADSFGQQMHGPYLRPRSP